MGSYKGSVDQHILNKVCYEKTLTLPLKYNVCYSEVINEDLKKYFQAYYSQKEINNAIENPVVFHWTGAFKPWKYYDIIFAQEWFKYFYKSPFYKVLNRIKRNNNITEKKYSFFGIPILKIKQIQVQEKWYLFGWLKFIRVKTYGGNN